MKNVKKKGFTIVELVIVVAVIAILAAVLIPTFSSLIKKANMSSDEVAVRNMNTILATEQVMDDNIKDVSKVRSILAQAGYNSDNLVPLSKDYKFYWSSTYNVVLLVNCESENEEEWQVVYPTEGYERAIEEFENKTNRGKTVFNLADLPYAEVNSIEVSIGYSDVFMPGGKVGDFNFINILEGETVDLDIALTFEAKETTSEANSASYRNWFVDFIITVNNALTDYTETEFYLAGKYDNPYTGNSWVVVDVTGAEMGPNDEVGLLRTMGMAFQYVDICDSVKEFHCGITTKEKKPSGLSITLQLVMYETSEHYDNNIVDHILYEYTYDYE